jgi:hypothetical protein
MTISSSLLLAMTTMMTLVVAASTKHPDYIEWSDDMKQMYLTMPRGLDAPPPEHAHDHTEHTCIHDQVARDTVTLVDPQQYDLPANATHEKRQAGFLPFRVVFDFQFLGGV